MTKKHLTEEQHEEGREIDELVFQYQAGNEASGEEILRRFGAHPSEPIGHYVGKWYNLIRYTRINFGDRDTRHFIGLYMGTKEMRDKLIPYYQYTDTKAAGVVIIERLRWQCSVIADEELKQELRFILLKLAKNYEKKAKKQYFTAYLKGGGFSYALYNYIDAAVMKPKEPLVHKRSNMIYVNDEVHYTEESLVKLDERAFTISPTLAFDDELGNSWIRGINCGDEFRTLTPLQRLIIKMSFYEGKSDRIISEKTCLHINTINRHKLKAIRIIKEEHEKILNGVDEE